MPRSVKVRAECIASVKAALLRNGFFRQKELAWNLELSETTVHSFLNGKAVDHKNFELISGELGFKPLDIADTQEPTPNSRIISEEQPEELLPIPDAPSTSALEYPTGQVPQNSPFYIKRPPIEEQCRKEICQPGCLIRIKAPQQMGKSSLLVRILDKARAQGNITYTVELTLIEDNFLTNLGDFLHCFCAHVAQGLTEDNQDLQNKLLNNLNEHWEQQAQRFGYMKACKDYFQQYLLREIPQNITLALENVDKVFEYPEIYKSFFGLLRSFHENAKSEDIWKKLRLVITHSTEAYVPMDINQSPFNVGLLVELPELIQEQVKKLAQLYQLDWNDTKLESLMAMVGGHPYLVRISMYKIANNEIALEQLLQTAPTIEGIFSSHLRGLESFLKQKSELRDAIKKLLSSSDSLNISKEIIYKLRALGLVKLQGNDVIISCELYRQYFQNS